MLLGALELLGLIGTLHLCTPPVRGIKRAEPVYNNGRFDRPRSSEYTSPLFSGRNRYYSLYFYPLSTTFFLLFSVYDKDFPFHTRYCGCLFCLRLGYIYK